MPHFSKKLIHRQFITQPRKKKKTKPKTIKLPLSITKSRLPSYHRPFKFRETQPSCINYLDLSFRKRLCNTVRDIPEMRYRNIKHYNSQGNAGCYILIAMMFSKSL